MGSVYGNNEPCDALAEEILWACRAAKSDGLSVKWILKALAKVIATAIDWWGGE